MLIFYFSMAIGAYKNTFIKFLSNFFPRTRVSLVTNAKRFVAIDMMKIKSSGIFIIPANLTLPTFIFNSHELYFASPFRNGFYKLLSTISIFPFICHNSHYSKKVVSQRAALPAELPGNIKFSILSYCNKFQLKINSWLGFALRFYRYSPTMRLL